MKHQRCMPLLPCALSCLCLLALILCFPLLLAGQNAPAPKTAAAPNPLNDPRAGLSTRDMVLIHKYILGVQPLKDARRRMAADVNRTQSITSFDIVELRKLILGNIDTLPQSTLWRYVPQKRLPDDGLTLFTRTP